MIIDLILSNFVLTEIIKIPINNHINEDVSMKKSVLFFSLLVLLSLTSTGCQLFIKHTITYNGNGDTLVPFPITGYDLYSFISPDSW